MGDESASNRPAQAFDYNALEESKRLLLQKKEKDIKTRLKRSAENIVAIGQCLIEGADEADELLKYLTKADSDEIRQQVILLASVRIVQDHEVLHKKDNFSPDHL